MAIARLAWIGPGGDLLAVELDAAGAADGVSFLSTLVGIHPVGGRIGPAPDW